MVKGSQLETRKSDVGNTCIVEIDLISIVSRPTPLLTECGIFIKHCWELWWIIHGFTCYYIVHCLCISDTWVSVAYEIFKIFVEAQVYIFLSLYIMCIGRLVDRGRFQVWPRGRLYSVRIFTICEAAKLCANVRSCCLSDFYFFSLSNLISVRLVIDFLEFLETIY